MNDHGLEQIGTLPTREKNTLDLILTTLPGQFKDVHSPDKLSDHDIVSGTLKIFIPPIKKPRRKVYLSQEGDYESIRKDTLEFAKKKYFNGHSDTRSVQENFDLLTYFIQDSADKHIPSKTSRSVSSIPWITPEIRRKIRTKNKTHAKAKKTGSSKLRSKFETLRREIKADVRKQHHLYVNNLVGDVKANPTDFYRHINSQKKRHPSISPRKGRMERVLLSRISKRQRNSMVSLRMCSIKMNTPRSHFWIDLYLSLSSLYINDISSDIESEIRLFADDCVCYHEIKDEEDTMKLQSDIDRLSSWARKWGMRFQPVKCNMMQLTRKRIKKIHASYILEGTDLENVESIKYLGVTITSDLRWNTHVSNVCTKANRTLGFLRRNLYSCPQEVKEAAYKGLVRPILDYGSSVWEPPGVVLQEELESVQKRAARFVTSNYNYETGSMTGILVQLKWESLKKRRKDMYYYIKVLKVKPVYQQMTLSPKLGVVEISTLWHFRLPLPIQMFIKVVSSPRLSGIGMPSPIL